MFSPIVKVIPGAMSVVFVSINSVALALKNALIVKNIYATIALRILTSTQKNVVQNAGMITMITIISMSMLKKV